MDAIVTLSNGLRVANFSSPHPFTFTDGSVLPAVSDDLAKRMMLDTDEKLLFREFAPVKEADAILHISITFDLNTETWSRIYYWDSSDQVDIVLIPLPVMTALKKLWSIPKILNSPFRVIRVCNRITKEIHIDKFCI